MGDFDREFMLETFIYEMNQLLEQLEAISILAEDGYSMDMINEIFRIMHTIKGSSAMMLFTSMSVAAHAIEDLFFCLRENNIQLADYSKVTDLTLEVTDFLKGETEKIESGAQPDGDGSELIARIKAYVAKLKGEEFVPEPGKKEAVPVVEKPVDVNMGIIRHKLRSYRAHVIFEADSEMENVRAYTIVHNLAPVAVDIIHDPEDLIPDESIEYIRNNGFNLAFKSRLDYDAVNDVFAQSIFIKELKLEEDESVLTVNLHNYNIVLKFEQGCEMENVRAYGVIHNIVDEVETIEYEPKELLDETCIDDIQKNGLRMKVSTIKNYEEIKTYLEDTIYLGELIINEINTNIEEKNVHKSDKAENSEAQKPVVAAKASPPKKVPVQSAISVSVQKLDQLLNLVGELVISEAMVTQNPDLAGLELESFTKEARQLHKIINDVQDTVMTMRMVPLSPTFFKMNRIVRDMCKQLDKEVNLEIIGEDTEVDKNIIEHISDPLMHIIRNSVDHGIEMPEDRLAKGKPKKGVVTLEAKNTGGDVLIIIRDDGAGFNKDAIVKKAVKQGLITKPVEEYADKEIYNFILLPGFSTNEQVTAYSGRGVGMDVVATNIEMVGGTVIADSIPGEGSTFVLKIPLTLAIIEGMIIKIGGTKYTIPIASIERSFKASQKDMVCDPSGNEMIVVRGEAYNFVRLKKEFDLEEGFDNIEDGIAMMLENGDQKICILADELIGEQQVVIKNIPKYIKKTRGISGCTVLGNGDISLIIDVAGFFDR